MGLEAHCAVTYRGQTAAAKVHLDADRLTVRGAMRLDIPLVQIAKTQARAGVLTLAFGSEQAAIALGKAAETWALRIRYPRSLIDKLGIKPDSRVAVLGVRDAAFERELAACGPQVRRSRRAKDNDVVVVAAEQPSALTSVRTLTALIKPAGAVWVVYPKGQQHITEAMVRSAGAAAGLVDVKVVAFSATHTGLKFMIPRGARKNAKPALP